MIARAGEADAMTDFRLVAEGLRFPEGPIALPDGDVLVVEIAAGRLTRVHPDGSKTVVATPGGGPNGAAMGPDGKCYVCNNGGFIWTEGKHWAIGEISQDSSPVLGYLETKQGGSGRVFAKTIQLHDIGCFLFPARFSRRCDDITVLDLVTLIMLDHAELQTKTNRGVIEIRDRIERHDHR